MLSLSNASRLAEALSEAEGEVEGTQNAITRATRHAPSDIIRTGKREWLKCRRKTAGPSPPLLAVDNSRL